MKSLLHPHGRSSDGSWKSGYRRLPPVGPGLAPGQDPYTLARQRYEHLRRRVGQWAIAGTSLAVSVFALSFLALGRQSTELPFLAPKTSDAAPLMAQPALPEPSDEVARLAKLEEENIQLRLAIEHSLHETQEAYDAASRWVAESKAAGDTVPVPPELRETLALPAPEAEPLVARAP